MSAGLAVKVRRLTAWYPGSERPVLRDLSFELRPGELLLVYGKSGSGKTSLLRVLYGTFTRLLGGKVVGEVRVLGKDPLSADPRWVLSNVTYVPQEPWDGILGHTVETEVRIVKAVGCTVAGESVPSVSEVLELMGLKGLENRLTYTLSAGEVQRLVIASAVTAGARLLLLDEPSSYLDLEARPKLVSLVKRAIEEGCAVILVDHNIGLWGRLASKLLVLDHGVLRYCGSFDPSALREAYGSPNGALRPNVKSKHRADREAVRVEHAWFRYPGSREPVVKDVSLSVNLGELVAIVGPNGSGKTTLLKLLAGVLRPSRGRVVARTSRVFVPDNPLLYFSWPTVIEEVTARSEDRAEALRIIRALGLEGLVHRRLSSLSSGERRRVAIASSLARGFKVLCIDEPTAGLDRWNRELVLDALKRAASRGAAVIVAGHGDELLQVADRVLKLESGAVREVGR